MKIPNEFLRVIFRHISPQQVLDSRFWYDEIDIEEFKKIMRIYIQRYSETELENMYYYLADTVNTEKINIYLVLFYCAEKMMTIRANKVCCRYDTLMQWRMTTFDLGQDLFATAYLAQKCTREEMKRIGFAWKFVLGHDNFHLNKLLKNGLVENHFHLYASVPVFPVSWISMMNDMYNSAFSQALMEIDRKKRTFHVSYSLDYVEKPLVELCRQAALIRILLFAWVTGKEIQIGDYWVNYEEYCHYLKHGENEKKQTLCGASLLELRSWINEDAFEQLFWERTIKNIQKILSNPYLLDEHMKEIQSNLNILQENSNIDYALQGLKKSGMSWEDNDFFFYAGERWLMYEILQHIFTSGEEKKVYMYNLFYAYILLKNRLFEEVIQTNYTIGFENFQIYQGRKANLRSVSLYQESVRQSMRDCVVNHQLSLLEARIVPQNSAEKYGTCIKKLDRIIDPEGKNIENYFYVIHFLKSRDTSICNTEIQECRHSALRKKVEKQAKALVQFRKSFPELAVRVLGIDAAGKEIGCRPEVFAPVFRYLCEDVGGKYLKNQPNVPQLRLTYHVGEDFLDIVDGMRAIEEAVRFLNLRCGDRIGHALALGMNPTKWYAGKKNFLMLSQQDYLDNLVWLYERMLSINYKDNDGIKEWIEGEFDTLFRKIYRAHMDQKELDAIMEGYIHYNQRINNKNAIKTFQTQFVFDIHTYFKAWQIRGDDPLLYQMGYFENVSKWVDTYEKAGINNYYPIEYNNRYIPEVGIINYLYHYNPGVRKEGKKIKNFHVKPMYIYAVQKVQEGMQYWIGKKGIGIETNPSSNFKISSMERYDEHPITTFYNKGLTTDEQSLKRCPQLNVSINTDDQGIFATSLENEYSLMVYALEHKHDENEKPIYAREMIYDWLINVKKMGYMQSFSENMEVCHDSIETSL